MRSLTIYAGVRVSLTDHVTFQNRISKDLIDLVPPPPAQYLSFAGAMLCLHDRYINNKLGGKYVHASGYCPRNKWLKISVQV